MESFKLTLRTLLGIGKALIVLWLPYIFKNPKRIGFFPKWIFSLCPGRAPYKDRIPLTPFEAAEWLEIFLKKDMNVFEYGSGGSTLFMAKRVKKIVSVEHNPKWYALISRLLKENNIFNCEYVLKEPKPMSSDNLSDPSDPQNYLSGFKRYQGFSFEEYGKVIKPYPDNFFDLVFIDGRARPSCIFHALRKLRKNGFLLLDDSDRERYVQGKELLNGWEKKVFFGPKPYVRQFVQTIIWQKPAL